LPNSRFGIGRYKIPPIRRRRAATMMKKRADTERLIYCFSLDERVPKDHLLRLLSEAVDFSFVYPLAKPFYSHTGPPSIDPVVLFKMALLQYLYDIPSERRLAKEIPLNIAWLWFLHYDLEEATPNHSVLSKARERFGIELYRKCFLQVVALCRQANLIQGDKVVIDATIVKANASLDSLVEREACRALPGTPEEFIDRVWRENGKAGDEGGTVEGLGRAEPVQLGSRRIEKAGPEVAEGSGHEASLGEATSGRAEGSERGTEASDEGPSAGQAEAGMGAGSTAPKASDATYHPLPSALTPLAAPESTAPEASDGEGEGEPGSERQGKVKVNEAKVSSTDPEAAVVRNSKGAVELAYKLHLGVDGGQARVITALDTTPANMAEAHELPALVEQYRQVVGHKPGEVVADAGYGTMDNYAYLQKAGILPSIPRQHPPGASQYIPKEEFTPEPLGQGVLCPEGQVLRREGLEHAGRLVRYRGSKKICGECPRKAECTKGSRRSVKLPAFPAVMTWATEHLETDVAKRSIKRRKVWVETANAELKNSHGMRKARYRGRWRVTIQALLSATAYNLKKLVKYGGKEGNEGAKKERVEEVWPVVLFCPPAKSPSVLLPDPSVN
jgi:transposase